MVTKKKLKLAKKSSQIVESLEVPSKIEVKQTSLIRSIVPGYVFRQPAFKYDPTPFALESERLHSKIYESSAQKSSLLRFMQNPQSAMIYGVSGNPDDSKANYFAAYLVWLHIRRVKSPSVIWCPMYGGFTNQLLDNAQNGNMSKPTMLVITNLTRTSTNVKLEKARDLITYFEGIPRVVVSAGIDPISFLTTRLYQPIHGLAYFSENLVKGRVQIY